MDDEDEDDYADDCTFESDDDQNKDLETSQTSQTLHSSNLATPLVALLKNTNQLQTPIICTLVPSHGILAGHNKVAIVLNSSTYSPSSAYWIRIQTLNDTSIANRHPLPFGAGSVVVPAQAILVNQKHILSFTMPSYERIVGHHVEHQLLEQSKQNNQTEETHLVQISVSGYEGVTQYSNSLLYKFTALPVVTKIHPESGPIYGGTTIKIKGCGFRNFHGQLAIKFTVGKLTHEARIVNHHHHHPHNSVIVHARHINDNYIECISPSFDSRKAGIYHIQVTINGGNEWSSKHAHCCYFSYSNWAKRNNSNIQLKKWFAKQPANAGQGADGNGAAQLHQRAEQEHAVRARR